MNRIPYVLRNKMAIQAILLRKKKIGWDKIHKDILFPTLYVKKTPYIFDNSFFFEKILRANTRIYFRTYKKYIWLSKMKENPHMYYYEPTHCKCIYNVNDLFSTNYYSDFDFIS